MVSVAFPLRDIPQAGGSLGLELASSPDDRCWWAAAWEHVPPPGLLGIAR